MNGVSVFVVSPSRISSASFFISLIQKEIPMLLLLCFFELVHGGTAGPIDRFGGASFGLVAPVGGSAGPIVVAVVLEEAVVGGSSGPMDSVGGRAGPMLVGGGESPMDGPMDGPIVDWGRVDPMAGGHAGVCTLRFFAGGSCGPLALFLPVDLLLRSLESVLAVCRCD